MNAKVKSFGRVFDVTMQTELPPNMGFKSSNKPSYGTSGIVEFSMEDVPGGTRITFTYDA